jgi:hypothetical protein
VRWRYVGAMVQKRFGDWDLVAPYSHTVANEVVARAAAARGGLEGAHCSRQRELRFGMDYAAAPVRIADAQRVTELLAVAGTVGHHE